MGSVGIRELRQQASALLRRVADGETIEITDHGHPVARLTPIAEESALERLRRNGDIDGPDDDFDDLPEPVGLPAGVEAPSALLARLRADER